MTTMADPSGLGRYYSHAYYGNGFYRDDHADEDAPPKLLSFETDFYGLAVDIDDLTKIYYRPFVEEDETGMTYLDCLSSSSDRMKKELTEGLLNMQVIVNEESTYTFRGMTPPSNATKPYNGTVVMWEAGKVSQRFELMDLIFKSNEDAEYPEQRLEGTWSLTIQVWPDAFCLTLSGKDVSNNDTYDVILEATADWKVDQCASPIESQVDVSLLCVVNADSRDAMSSQVINIAVTANDEDSTLLETKFNDKMASYEGAVTYGYFKQPNKLVRKFSVGYTDIRDYDEYEIQVDLDSSDVECSTIMIPFVLSISMPANVTGMCPMLLVNGVPSGIPVQCSKNWHWAKVGAYAKLYIMLPATPGELAQTNTYVVRISYGFYGTLPSASIAQLCLYGYGNMAPTGRWDQMAIGCWGETLCLDSEFSCGVQGPITDVRGLFFVDKEKSEEKEKQKWGWSNCAWGGDWLRVFDGADIYKRLYARNVKVAYLSHGPCLTHIKYHGFYGCHHKDQVEFNVSVRTLRTDDYCRTFFDFEYQVHDAVSLKNGYLHNLLNRAFHTPSVAHGNLGNMKEEHTPPDGLKNNEVFVENKFFTGAAPYWIFFPGSKQFPDKNKDKKQMPDGSKNMIIRSFEANVGETCYTQPAFSLVNECSSWGDQGDKPSLMANIELPDGLQELQAGDSISMTVEWLTLSREADDYYGPNSQYKSFLAQNPNSWRVPFRDVQLNGSLLSVDVENEEEGTLVNKYPLKVQVTSDEGVTLCITAGAGAMPMEFCGLADANYRLFSVNRDMETGEETETMLDQSTHEDRNDYWQTDYDFQTMTYSMTFNPMMGTNSSSWKTVWRLKKYNDEE